MAQVPDGSNRCFVLEQEGRILGFEARSDVATATLLLDITNLVRNDHNEEGLLALAFHPNYSQNRFIYLWHSASNPLRNVLARYQVGPGSIATGSRFVLLDVEKPFGNHNGATLVFGSDGCLYISIGDGGAGGDPHNNAQNLGSLLGKVLRIDVDNTGGGRNYAIPPANPFANVAGARPEIWAYGLRNVWRMSFDRDTGDLWAGDVGQNAWEEIDRIEPGANYGWNFREGRHTYRSGSAPVPLVEPVWEYSHDEGASITGGYVYRGTRLPELRGAYIYADFVTGTVWALRAPPGGAVTNQVLVRQPRNIASFAETADGELYLLAFDGRIYQLEAVTP
jgi:glucose/arabinose dehydrogenase